MIFTDPDYKSSLFEILFCTEFVIIDITQIPFTIQKGYDQAGVGDCFESGGKPWGHKWL